MITGSNETYDSYVSDKNPASNYKMDKYLRIGKDAPYGIRRTYIKFKLPSNISDLTISSAYIRLKKYSGVEPMALVTRVLGNWDSGTINWNNKPSGNTLRHALKLDSNSWYMADVSQEVRQWAAGTYPNYGFMIFDQKENDINHWTTFYSSDSGYPNRPELIINYKVYKHTVNSYFDEGFNVFQGKTNNQSIDLINGFMNDINKRYSELLNLTLTYTTSKYNSPID